MEAVLLLPSFLPSGGFPAISARFGRKNQRETARNALGIAGNAKFLLPPLPERTSPSKIQGGDWPVAAAAAVAERFGFCGITPP
jgi:hypothetical protein